MYEIFPKYVVTMEPGAYRGVTDTGMTCCSLKEFLEKGELLSRYRDPFGFRMQGYVLCHHDRLST